MGINNECSGSCLLYFASQKVCGTNCFIVLPAFLLLLFYWFVFELPTLSWL
eukprot:c53050_g1_i1 orf=69-221(+)